MLWGEPWFYSCYRHISQQAYQNMSKLVRVGAVQSEPVWLDLNGSVDKTISLIEEAAAEGVNVLGFPEVWIPGYPW